MQGLPNMRDQPLYHSTGPGDRDGTVVLRLEGPLTLGNLFGFQAEFRETRPPVLIVDRCRVHYLDSAGLGLLVNAYVSAQNEGRRYMLVGLSQRVLALLETAGVHHLLSIYPTVRAAEAAL